VGTPLYLAPEQVKHQGYDFKVDIWSLGCLLYLLTALEPPFHGHNLIQLGHDIVRRTQKPLSERYSPEWRTLVAQLLTKRLRCHILP
jgi:NIMA (never in mitosis gene a)-related kinase